MPSTGEKQKLNLIILINQFSNKGQLEEINHSCSIVPFSMFKSKQIGWNKCMTLKITNMNTTGKGKAFESNIFTRC